MEFEPTNKEKNHFFGIAIAAVVYGISLVGAYLLFNEYLYLNISEYFSVMYIIPFICLSLTAIILRRCYVGNNFGYWRVVKISNLVGFFGAVIFGAFLYLAYTYFKLPSRSELFNATNQWFNPAAIAIISTSTYIILNIIYSFFIAIFAKK